MAQSCTYTFNGPDGKEVTIRGIAAMKAYLVDGGMEFFQTKGVRFEGLDKSPSVLRATDADPSNQRITRAQADGFLSGFLAKYANAPQVTLVNTFDQLPATVQQEARNQGGNAGDTKGVFHRGQVYLVAGNHSTVADFEATVFHEVIGHAGVRALFGDDFVKTASRLFMQLGGQAGLVKIMQRRGMGQQASDYIKGIAQAQRKELDQIRADMAAGKPGAQRRWNDAIARFVLTEEVFAHIAEQVKDRPSMMDKMKELIGKIRQWLRDKGFAELSNLGETDILFMLSKARQNMQGKDGNITRNGVTVSGNDLMTSDGRRLNKDDPDYASAMRLADLLGLRQEPGVTTFRNEQGTIEVDGIQRPRTNSEGRPIHPTEEGIRNFWRWFGDSKVVDADGKPLVVYRGGNVPFEEGRVAEGFGAHFGTSQQANKAAIHGVYGDVRQEGGEPSVAPVFLRIKNPWRYDGDVNNWDYSYDLKRAVSDARYDGTFPLTDDQLDEGVQRHGSLDKTTPWSNRRYLEKPEQLRAILMDNGVDGVIYRNRYEGDGESYIVFSPNQIKSATGNTGAFDPNEAPITLRRAPSATQQQGKGRIGATVDSFLNGRNDMPEWLAQMPAETQEAARKAGIWTQQKPLAERLKDIRQNALKRLQQGLLDQFAPLKELVEREYVLARLTKSADAPLESLLLYGRPFMNDAGAIDVNLEKGGLIGALQDLNGEHDRFFAWIAGNRAEQLKKEGRENLFSDTDIFALKDMNDGTMADGRSRKAVYESMLLKFNSYSKSVLDIAEKAGIVAKEDRAIWEKDFYVPFYRAMEDGDYKGPKSASGLVNQYAFKKLQGGTDNLNDLMQNTLRNWSHLLSASLKNQAAAAALSSAEKAGVAVPVSQKQKGSVSYLGRVKRKIPKGQTYTENGAQKVSDGTAEIEIVGEKHFMVEDPFILDAITSLEWAGWNNPAMKWMQRAKHYLTLGVTISPTFKIRNLIRDQIAAIGLNPMSYNMMQNLSQGWKGTDKDSAEYAKMLAGGGLMRFGTFLEDDRAQHMKRLIDAGVEDSTILTSSEKVKAALGKAWDWWQEVGDRSENIARAAIYKQRFDQLVKEGKTQDEAHLLASFAARDSMDFSLQGQWGSIRFLTQLVPFLNARLQGLYKLGRDGVAPTVRLVTGNAGMGDRERAQRFGAVVGTVALASIALMLAYEDDEDWKNREEWDRDTYWWFKVGDTAYRIPKPFEIGAIGTLAERGLETAMNGFDKESRRIFVERLGAMMTGTFAMNPVPQLFKPLIDLYANTDSFTGRPIETMGMERLSKSERIGVGTSATAQLIGKATSLVGLSPVQVDHLIDGYFSWLGTHLAMTADFALRPMMGLPDQPARKWPDGYFVVGDFAKDLPANQSRYLTQFYEQSKKVQEAMADIRYYQSLGMTEKALKLSQENKDEIQLYKTYSAAQRQIGEINKHIRMVQMSGKDAAVKRDEIDRLTQARNKIAELTETRRAALQ